MYGYGSYGASMDADFSASRLSLLDRGFVFAIAHIRGGGELGQQWYEDGKFLCKKNTFNDYLDVCDALLAQGYGDPRFCYGMGGSDLPTDKREAFGGALPRRGGPGSLCRCPHHHAR